MTGRNSIGETFPQWRCGAPTPPLPVFKGPGTLRGKAIQGHYDTVFCYVKTLGCAVIGQGDKSHNSKTPLLLVEQTFNRI